MQLVPTQLVLQTGEVFKGLSEPGQNQICYGEVVFSTGMVGYVESLTDPSYAGQILVFTYPLIGNYGVCDPSEWESDTVHVKGVVLSELTAYYSDHNAKTSLLALLDEKNIPYIVDVDTRALTKRLREKGVTPGAIVPGSDIPKTFEDFSHIHWVKQVSLTTPRFYSSDKDNSKKTVIIIDCGVKENIIRSLLHFPLRLKRVPYDYDYTQEDFDGVFISNGPGDPEQCQATIAILQKALKLHKPIFGICLGTQLMALAAGAKVYKLPFGHRSHNQPCMDIATQKCYLTSQNHGYAVDEKSLPNDWQVTFRNLNDQSVEGISHKTLPYFAVQFHPEAAPGPMDTQWLFEKFYHLIIQQHETINAPV